MTVKELMDALSSYLPDQEVVIYDTEWQLFDPIKEVRSVEVDISALKYQLEVNHVRIRGGVPGVYETVIRQESMILLSPVEGGV